MRSAHITTPAAFLAAIMIAIAAAPQAFAQTAPPSPPVAAVDMDEEIGFWLARTGRDPDDHISPTRLGYARLKKARASGNFRLYAEAETAFSQALARSPGHYTALLGLATARAARHRFREAIDLGRQALSRQPEDADAYAVIGDAYLGLGEVAGAAEAYAELEKRAPGFDAATRRANLLALRGQTRQAIAQLRQAIAEGASRSASADAIAWCHIQIGGMLFDTGDWPGAAAEYKAALALVPTSFVALEHTAELHAAEGRDGEALRMYEQVIATAPHPDFFEAVAKIHERGGRKEEAGRWYDRALAGYLEAVKQGDPGYYRPLALFYADVRPDGDAAVSWARKDLELRQDPVAWSTLAWALSVKGDVAAAAEASRKATASGIEDAHVWFRAGVIEAAAGNAAAARGALERALKINPRFDRAEEARRLLSRLTAASFRLPASSQRIDKEVSCVLS